MSLPIYELKINENENAEAEVSFVALVDAPAIKKNFIAFNEEFVHPGKKESKDEFLNRCIPYMVKEGKDSDQAVAICQNLWSEKFNDNLISFDFDDTLTTERGRQMAEEMIADGFTVYVISARHAKETMMPFCDELGIPAERVFATGSNAEKIAKIKELNIGRHYDNNTDVIAELPGIGIKFSEAFQDSYTDYPKAASENAKIALRWAEENGWGDCGTPVGKKRANDLAAGRPVSRETIARMAAFDRHRQNSQRELGDGCGRLMWLAWGGDEGVEWAQRKLEQIDREGMQAQPLKFSVVNEEQRIITGPLMLADELIYRNNEKLGEHYVKFSAETIKKIAIKFAKKKYQTNVNLMHDGNQQVDGVTMFESWLVDKNRGVKPMAEFSEVPDGSWFGSFYVENDQVWAKIKDGGLRGYSVEGIFEYDEPISAEENALRKIGELLNELCED